MIPRAGFRRTSIAAVLVGATALCASMVPSSAGELRIAAVEAPSLWNDATTSGSRTRRSVEDVRLADADCSAAAAEAAAETGGQVLSVSSREEGGRTLCVVTVLVPGGEGERPRKRTITVPQ